MAANRREVGRIAEEWLKEPASYAEGAQFDTRGPSVARVWNYLLGGRDNFAADREAARQLISVAPVVADVGVSSRAFLRRTVSYLAGEAGIRQFLDIGAGFPSAGSTHEIAQAVAPSSRIVYVDNDPMVITYGRALQHSSPDGAISYVEADARDPTGILEQAGVTLNLGEPVAVVLVDTLNFVPGRAEALSVLSGLLDALAGGSYLVITQLASDIDRRLLAAEDRWNQIASAPMALRNRAEVIALLDGLEIVGPGVVAAPEWRPAPGDPQPAAPMPMYGAVARKPSEPGESTLTVTIYLSNEGIHDQVEAAVDDWLAGARLMIGERDEPIVGSWFRRMQARVKQAVRTSAAQDALLTAAHAVDTRMVLAQDATVTATLLQGVAPVIGSLQPTKDAVVRAGAVLIVKVDWMVHVHQLTPAQQVMLNHQPQLLSSPTAIITALQISGTNANGVTPETESRGRPNGDGP